MKDGLGRIIKTKCVGWKVRTYTYLIDDGSEAKKATATKRLVIKRKVIFKNYKNCLQATQLDNKISYLEEKNINIDNLKKDYKEFIKKTINQY